jgi:iron complex transport system substrate-binding protein
VSIQRVFFKRFFFALCWFSIGVAAVSVSAEPPQRIASLNMCIDQLLVKLVPKARIASVTYLSANPQLSTISDQLEGLHINHGLAEEIVPLNPDLIIAGDFGAVDAVVLLQRLGYTAERLPLPRTLDDISTHIENFGVLVGAQQAAVEMAQAIRAQLAEVDAQQLSFEQQTTAIWYSSNGVVAGGETLEHELMTRAGYRNLAAEHQRLGFAKFDLEELLVYAPEVIIVETGYAENFSLASEYLQHPALRKRSRLVELPSALSVCTAPVVADALRALQNGVKQPL